MKTKLFGIAMITMLLVGVSTVWGQEGPPEPMLTEDNYITRQLVELPGEFVGIALMNTAVRGALRVQAANVKAESGHDVVYMFVEETLPSPADLERQIQVRFKFFGMDHASVVTELNIPYQQVTVWIAQNLADTGYRVIDHEVDSNEWSISGEHGSPHPGEEVGVELKAVILDERLDGCLKELMATAEMAEPRTEILFIEKQIRTSSPQLPDFNVFFGDRFDTSDRPLRAIMVSVEVSGDGRNKEASVYRVSPLDTTFSIGKGNLSLKRAANRLHVRVVPRTSHQPVRFLADLDRTELTAQSELLARAFVFSATKQAGLFSDPELRHGWLVDTAQELGWSRELQLQLNDLRFVEELQTIDFAELRVGKLSSVIERQLIRTMQKAP